MLAASQHFVIFLLLSEQCYHEELDLLRIEPTAENGFLAHSSMNALY